MGSALGKSTQLETTMIISVSRIYHDQEGHWFERKHWHGSQLTACGVTDPYIEYDIQEFSSVRECIQKHHAAVCKIREIPQDI